MKILILTNIASGLYLFRKELIERLLSSYSVAVAVPSGEFIDDLQRLGCRIIPFEFNRRGTNPFADLK